MGKKLSIQIKYILLFVVTVVLISSAIIVSLGTLRTQVLRNQATAVADQVVSFRAWVATGGMVWVNKLAPNFPDFLASAEDGHGGLFYGKNPALATRELSTIANATSTSATFRVTSDEYRHEANKPDSFESEALAAFKQSKDMQYTEAYKGSSYRYARPILVKKGCLKCHGKVEDAPPAVIEKYGSDKAFGYKVGDVRGIISVDLPTLTLGDVLPTLVNPITLGLLALAFVLNFLFTQRMVINRLRRLTNDAEAIAEGKMTTELQYTVPENSNDEIDHTFHAVHLLQRSLSFAAKRMQKMKTAAVGGKK